MAHGDSKISKILYSKSGGATDTLEIHDSEAVHAGDQGVISEAMLAKDAVTSEKISDNAITSAKIQDGTIAANDLNAALLKRITDLESAWDSISQASTSGRLSYLPLGASGYTLLWGSSGTLNVGAKGSNAYSFELPFNMTDVHATISITGGWPDSCTCNIGTISATSISTQAYNTAANGHSYTVRLIAIGKRA